MLEGSHYSRGHHQRDQCRCPHPREELTTAEMEMSEHDQVYEVRTKQE